MRFGWLAAVAMGMSAPAAAQVQASGFIDTAQVIDLNLGSLNDNRFLLRIKSRNPISALFFGDLSIDYYIYNADGSLSAANDLEYSVSQSAENSTLIDFVERSLPLKENLSGGRVRYNVSSYSNLRLRLTGGAEATSYSVQLLRFPAGVPEPASWALMILGFGAVGGSLRYRKIRPAFSSTALR